MSASSSVARSRPGPSSAANSETPLMTTSTSPRIYDPQIQPRQEHRSGPRPIMSRAETDTTRGLHAPFSTPNESHRTSSDSHLRDPAATADTDRNKTTPWQSFRPTLTLENQGSVARDHLASERTFLAYVRTSLAIASTGVGS